MNCIKKALLILFITVFSSLIPTITANAQEYGKALYEGYTEDGIHYTVYEINQSDEIAVFSSSYTVERRIVFDGLLTPPSSIQVMESERGSYYSGTLYLISYNQLNNKTTAIYKGTLYPTY